MLWHGDTRGSIPQHDDAMDSMFQHGDSRGLYPPAGHSKEQGQPWVGRCSVRLGERSDSEKAFGI